MVIDVVSSNKENSFKHQIPYIIYCHPNLTDALQYFMNAGYMFPVATQSQMNMVPEVKIEMDPMTVKFEDENLETKEGVTKNENNRLESIVQYYPFPGETKNYYKNIGQKLANHINEEFKHERKVQEDPHIRGFLKIESQKFNRLSISKLLKSKVGRRIARQFFANYRWTCPFLTQHKTELDLYFRHNCQLYVKKKKNLPKNLQVKEEQE